MQKTTPLSPPLSRLPPGQAPSSVLEWKSKSSGNPSGVWCLSQCCVGASSRRIGVGTERGDCRREGKFHHPVWDVGASLDGDIRFQEYLWRWLAFKDPLVKSFGLGIALLRRVWKSGSNGCGFADARHAESVRRSRRTLSALFFQTIFSCRGYRNACGVRCRACQISSPYMQYLMWHRSQERNCPI